MDEFTRYTSTAREAIKILSLRKTYGETQSALVLMPSNVAGRVTGSGPMRIGLVYWRTRIREKRKLCFRCLKFGHEARSCLGPDNSSCCRRCGIAGHWAANCQAGIEEAAEFRRSLAYSPQNVGPLGATQPND